MPKKRKGKDGKDDEKKPEDSQSPEHSQSQSSQHSLFSLGSDLGLGLKSQHGKIQFFKPEGPGTGRSARVLQKEVTEKERREEEERLAREAKRRREEEDAREREMLWKRSVAKSRTSAMLLNDTFGDDKKYTEKLAALDLAISQIPQIALGMAPAKKPVSDQETHGHHRRNQFTRPPRRIWYTPLPLTIKRYYRTNWKKIRFDVRSEMRKRNFWPKLWINFGETHPKRLYELMKTKKAMQAFDKRGQYGIQKEFDWGKGVHPDYIDWILSDIAPHPGKYYYDDDDGDHEDDDDEEKKDKLTDEKEAVRRASFEEGDFPIEDWFMKPPRYIPDSPPSPPFDTHDFCGYGNRENSYFLDFTLPREILHYYAPPSKIQQFFRQIPKPPYAFPGYTFKRWLNYPLEQKLPQYHPFPKRFSAWTRGKIGDSLLCNSSEWKLDDPLIHRCDLTYNPYHDPHTKRYMLNKTILDRIWKQGLINDKGEVMCTMKQFNQNRSYLRDYEWLEECLRRWTAKWISRLEHNQITKDTNIALLDWDSIKRAKQEKYEKAYITKKLIQREKDFRNIRLQERYDKTIGRAIAQKEKKQVEVGLRARQRRNMQRRRRANMNTLYEGRKLLLQKVNEDRQENADRLRINYRVKQITDREERRVDHWTRHMEFAKRRMEELKEVKRKLEEEQRKNVNERKFREFMKWKHIRENTARKRERIMRQTTREYELAKKYFYIWLNKTRKNRRLTLDGHETLWGQHFLYQYVQFFKKDVIDYIPVGNKVYEFVQKLREDKRRQQAENLRLQSQKNQPRTAWSMDSPMESDMAKPRTESTDMEMAQKHLSYTADDEAETLAVATPVDEEKPAEADPKGYEGDIDEDEEA